MKKVMLVTAVASLTLLAGCSGQQVTDTAIGVAKVPFKVVGAAATATAATAGVIAGTAAGGPVGGAVGGTVAGTLVGAITP